MNSTTGDFSEIRKSTLIDEIYNRGAYSCVKRQPRKLMNLRPLNLHGIKKEIEEGSEDDEKLSISITNNTNSEENKQTITEVDENEEPDDGLLRDITNLPDQDAVKTSVENNVKYLTEKPKNRFSISNANYNTQVTENNFILQPKNDSFDLDFSALSISTPVKKNDNVDVTDSNVKSDFSKEQFKKFITPKINNVMPKNQTSLLKKSFPKTPNYFNNTSANKLASSTCGFNQKSLRATPLVFESQPFLKHSENESIVSNSIKEKTNPPSYKVPMKSAKDEIIFKNKESQYSGPPNILKDNTFKRIKVNDTEYIMFSLIGKGGSSDVYQCYNLESNIHVAIKCVSLQNSASANGYINEVKLLQQLQGCNKIIKMYDYEILESQKKLFVVLEHGGKDLSTILKQLASQKSHIPMYMLLFYWMEMLYAVKQIHSHGIIHSDLKPANFLKVDEGLKLIDFGIASSVQTDMTSVIKTKQEGSCNYISPEALITDSTNQCQNTEKYKIHYKSDVWSLGCILYQFVYRRTPFQHIVQLWPKLAAIMNPEHKISYPEVDWISPKIIGTIKKCLQYNVKSRPSVEELITEYEEILHNI